MPKSRDLIAGSSFALGVLIAGFVIGPSASNPAIAQVNCSNHNPGFAVGGNVFQRLASQWNQYFSSKVDSVNGILCNPTIVGTLNQPPVSPGTMMVNATASSAPPADVAPEATTILVTGGKIDLYKPPGVAGSYTSTNVTIDTYGRVIAAASGSSCGVGQALGTVLFADGSTGCTGDAARLFWQSTADLSHGHNLGITGGDVSGWTVSIRSDALGAWPANRSELRIGNNNNDPTDSYGQMQSFDAAGDPSHFALNASGGTVSIGTPLKTLVSQPEAAQVVANVSAPSLWSLAVGSSNGFTGGIYSNANRITEFRSYDYYGGGVFRAQISGDPTSTSFVPNRFTAQGLTDGLLLSCNGVSTNGSGDLTCLGGGGSGTLGGDNTWLGTNTFTSVVGTVVTEATTARTLGALDCGKLIRYTNGSAVAVTVPNSLPAGCNVAGMQIGAGQVVVGAGAGATFLANPHAFTKSVGVNAVFGVTVDTNVGGTAATFTFVGDGA